MADSTTFTIEMLAKLTGADTAAAQLAVLEERLTAAGAASKQAADAVLDGQQAYAQAEAAANRAAAAVEKLQAAGKFDEFNAKHQQLVETANAAKSALAAEGAALDALKTQAAAAAKQEANLAKAMGDAKTHAAGAAKAQQAAARAAQGTGKVNELAEAFGRLGGPAGQAGQKVFGLVDGVKKLVGAAGSGGVIVALGVAVAAMAFGFAAATLAVAKWGIELADAKRSATDVLKLSNQMKRFQKLIGETFGGLKTDKLMQGLQILVNLFDKNTAAGKALQSLFEALFQPLIDFAASHMADIERFFLGMIVGALKLAIFLKPLVKGFSEFFSSLGLGSVDLATLGKWFFYVAAAGVALVTIIGGVLVAAVATLAAIFAIPIAVVGGFWGLLTGFVSWLVSAWENPKAALTSFGQSFVAIGASLVAGFIAGITAGIGRAVAAVQGLGSAAMGALKGALGIASPSKVFEEFGDMTAEGFAQGVEGSTAPTGALENMVGTPDAGGVGGGRGAVSVTIQQMNVGGSNAKEVAENFASQLLSILEGDALQLGGAPA